MTRPISSPPESAGRAAGAAANGAFDRLANAVRPVSDSAGAWLGELSTQAGQAARRASDDTRSRIRDEPLKAVLIAAAAGALVAGVAALLARPRREP